MDIKVKSQKKLKLETHFFRYIFFIGCPVCWQLNKYQTKKKAVIKQTAVTLLSSWCGGTYF